jgi:hypothetical protein
LVLVLLTLTKVAEQFQNPNLFKFDNDLSSTNSTMIQQKLVRITFFFAAAVLVSTVNSSCKKCMQCTSTKKSNGATVDTYPESCGKKATLDVQELNYRANLPDSLTINCNRD